MYCFGFLAAVARRTNGFCYNHHIKTTNNPPPTVVNDPQHAAEEENQDLWVADWDDEATGPDFQQRLKQELGRDAMAE